MNDDELARAFDSGEALMRESSESPGSWSAVSLARFVKDQVRIPPSERRDDPAMPDVGLRSAVWALTDRGIDGHAYIRHGMGAALADRIAALSSLGRLLPRISAHGPVEGSPLELPVEIAPWSALVDDFAGQRTEASSADGVLLDGIMELTHDWYSRVRAWTRSAPIADVLDWKCPEPEVLMQLPHVTREELELDDYYGWVSDRLTTTYLTDWRTESLHREYRWIQGERNVRFPESVMKLRTIGGVDLNSHIAARAVQEPENASLSSTVGQLKIQALMLLKSNEWVAATSVFKVVARLVPKSAEALNNIGFSLMPQSPRQALSYLRRAAAYGYGESVINVHNRMCCHVELRENREALIIAEELWQQLPDRQVPAYLWHQDKAGWSVRLFGEARREVAALASRIAEALGHSSIEEWRARERALRGTSRES